MTVCTVTGNIRSISNALKPGAVITFARREVVGQDGKVVVSDPVTATADSNGDLTVNLYAGNYQASYRGTNGNAGFTVAVPEAASALLSDLIGAPDYDVVYPLFRQVIDPASAAQVFGVKNGQNGALTLTYDGSGNVTSTVEVFPSVTVTSTYTYSGSNLTQIDATDGATTWRQTLTYSGSNVATFSAWVQQ